MANLITVGCKLPQGVIMEVGYKVTPGGVVKGPNYKRVVLAGANQHSIITGALRTPSPRDLRPGITENVDEAVFDEWAKKGGVNLVKNMLVYKAPNRSDAEAIAKEITPEKTGMEAVDPTKHPGITKLKEDDDTKAA
jgi:hypothetical protein